ncbi:hypothetical protein HPB50_027779 [Hyalomma asiaticum]|nr:hypothetical protein HPB50_027779 [Hyalomma asiaticum]
MPVEASGVMLHCSSGQLLSVEDQAHISVRFGDREATLPLYLTRWSSLTLLGQNWIHTLGVRLPEYQEAGLHVLSDVSSLLTDLKSLFQPGGSSLRVRMPRIGPHGPGTLTMLSLARPLQCPATRGINSNTSRCHKSTAHLGDGKGRQFCAARTACVQFSATSSLWTLQTA